MSQKIRTKNSDSITFQEIPLGNITKASNTLTKPGSWNFYKDSHPNNRWLRHSVPHLSTALPCSFISPILSSYRTCILHRLYFTDNAI